MKELVQRVDYLNFLKRHRDKPIIKVVSGVRRSGKSTLFKLYRHYLEEEGVAAENIVDINFEDMQFNDLREAKALYAYLIAKIENKEKSIHILR